MTPMYDVIIPSYKEDPLPLITSICLHHKNDVHVFLMDNGRRTESTESTDGELSWYKMPSNLGFVKAVNAGIAMSQAPYIVLQNDDTQIFTNIYDQMRKYFDYQPGLHFHVNDTRPVGIVGAVSSPGFSWVSINNRPEHYPQYSHLGKDGDDKYPQLSMETHAKIAQDIREQNKGQFIEASMLPFFCVMIKREVIEKVGYLSEEYGAGLGDDDQYCARVTKAGYKLLLALDSYVYHKQRTTFKALYTTEELKTMQEKNIKMFEDWKANGGY